MGRQAFGSTGPVIAAQAADSHAVSHHPGLRLTIGVLLFSLGLGLALARLAPLHEVGGLRIGAHFAMVDFREVIYYPTRAFLDGLNPFDSSRYLELYRVPVPVSPYAPALFLLFAPFGLLPLGVSSVAYFVLNIALTLVLAWTALRLSGKPPALSAVFGVSGVLLLSRPGHWNLLSGQVTIIIVLATYVALIFTRRAPWLAGTGLTLALLKPSFGFPLVPLLLARGGTRAVAWGFGLTAALNIPVLMVLVRREGGLAPFIASVVQGIHLWGSHPETDSLQSVWRIDLTATTSRLLDYPLGVTGAFLVSAAVLLPVMVLQREIRPAQDSENQQLFIALVCCAMLLSLFHQTYDLLLLALPAVVLGRTLLKSKNASRTQVMQAGAFAFFSLNYLATQSALTAVNLSPGNRGAVVAANGLVLSALFISYLVEARRLVKATNRV